MKTTKIYNLNGIDAVSYSVACKTYGVSGSFLSKWANKTVVVSEQVLNYKKPTKSSKYHGMFLKVETMQERYGDFDQYM